MAIATGAPSAGAPPPHPALPPDFARLVQDALAYLYDPVYLQSHPLAKSLARAGAAAGQTGAAEAWGRALRRRLEEAIAALEPGPAGPRGAPQAGPHAERSRGARLLRLRYVEALEPAAVQRELGISRAQLYRERTRALDALTLLLAEQWPVDPDVRGDFELQAGPEPTNGAHQVRGLDSEVGADTSLRYPGVWHPVLLFLLFGASWAAAWFAVWTFAQTMPWLAAWGVGGAVSGLATGLLLRESDAAIGWNRVRVVALGWTAAWVVAWLVGRSVAALMGWAVRSELLAGLDPDDPAYAVGRIAAWAGAGLLVGVVAQTVRSPSRWLVAGLASLAWVVASATGHGLFWALDPSVHAPGARFAVSGLCEGAIGGGTTLWLLRHARTGLGGSRPTKATAG